MSSYKEYLQIDEGNDRICKYNGILEIDPEPYREFTEDRISYQKELAKIKHLMAD
jgi:hypothetical protein